MFKGFTRVALTAFFYGAFAAFLLPSVPRVAYFFKAHMPYGGTEDQFWWTVAYGIAIAIDITILVMTASASSMKRNHTSWWDRAQVWFFIWLATVISLYANWMYSLQFNPPMFSVAAHQYPFLTENVNAIIASLFPLFQIIYSTMADVVVGREITAADLAKQIEAEAEKQPLVEQLSTIRASSHKQSISGLFGMGAYIKDQWQQNFGQPIVQESAQADTPKLEWDGNKVISIQFPGKEPVQVHTEEVALSPLPVESIPHKQLSQSTPAPSIPPPPALPPQEASEAEEDPNTDELEVLPKWNSRASSFTVAGQMYLPLRVAASQYKMSEPLLRRWIELGYIPASFIERLPHGKNRVPVLLHTPETRPIITSLKRSRSKIHAVPPDHPSPEQRQAGKSQLAGAALEAVQ